MVWPIKVGHFAREGGSSNFIGDTNGKATITHWQFLSALSGGSKTVNRRS